MSGKLVAGLGADFTLRYSLPIDMDVSVFTGNFVIYSGVGGFTILNITSVPSANGSYVTIGTNWVQVQIGARDLAFIAGVPSPPTNLFAFDFFMASGGITTKVHGGPFIIAPVGAPNSSNFDEIQVAIGQVEYDIAVDSGFSFAYISSPDLSLPSEVSARIAADAYLQEQISGVSVSLSTGLAQVNASISTESSARVTADSAIATEITTLSATVDGLADGGSSNAAAITEEATARANGDSANATLITNLTATVTTQGTAIGTNAAAITTEQTARANGDSANASSISSLSATVSSQGTTISANTAAISTEATARAAGDSANAASISTLTATVAGNTAAISTEATARAAGDSANASSISSLATSVGANTAAISTEATARANGDSANASSISSLATTVGSYSTSISTIEATQATQAGTLADLSASYSVVLDVNGYQTGFYQQSTGATSSFKIQAADFVIEGPSGSPFTPLIVDTVDNIVKMSNVEVDTLKIDSVTSEAIATNAAILPVLAAISGPATGNGSYSTLLTETISLSTAGTIKVDVSAGQSMPSGTRSWGFNLYIDGTIIAPRHGTAFCDAPAFFGFESGLAAGSHTVRLDWMGQDSSVTLSQLDMFVQAMPSTA